MIGEDIMNDGDLVMVTPTLSGVKFPDGVQIMQGLTSTWGSVHEEVIAEVASLIKQHPDYTLETTGHSLGGSLTYMSYIALAQNFPDKNITSNALAAFPIGNEAFAAFGTAQHGLLRRGNNAGDGVPVSNLRCDALNKTRKMMLTQVTNKNMYVSFPTNLVHYGQVCTTIFMIAQC